MCQCLVFQLFRKDLISAMKIPDSEPLQPEDYHVIADPWRQEWERGVQVPVNPDRVKNISVRVVPGNENNYGTYPFKMPKKLLHSHKDELYETSKHELHETQKMAEQVCRYDLDDLDAVWLKTVNEERKDMGELVEQVDVMLLYDLSLFCFIRF